MTNKETWNILIITILIGIILFFIFEISNIKDFSSIYKILEKIKR